ASLETVRAAAEAAVRAVPGVTDVLVALTAERATGAPPRGPGTAGAGKAASALQVRHIIAVASGKGGVGKSTTAANIALALAAKGLKVGLLDADVYGPSMPTLFGIRHKPNSDGKSIDPIQSFGISIM